MDPEAAMKKLGDLLADAKAIRDGGAMWRIAGERDCLREAVDSALVLLEWIGRNGRKPALLGMRCDKLRELLP